MIVIVEILFFKIGIKDIGIEMLIYVINDLYYDLYDFFVLVVVVVLVVERLDKIFCFIVYLR